MSSASSELYKSIVNEEILRKKQEKQRAEGLRNDAIREFSPVWGEFAAVYILELRELLAACPAFVHDFGADSTHDFAAEPLVATGGEPGEKVRVTGRLVQRYACRGIEFVFSKDNGFGQISLSSVRQQKEGFLSISTGWDTWTNEVTLHHQLTREFSEALRMSMQSRKKFKLSEALGWVGTK